MAMDSHTHLNRLLGALRAAAEPTRLRLLALLAESALTVSEITQILGQSQPRVSRHLKLLSDAGLVDRIREGNWIFYRMVDPDGTEIARLAADLVRHIPGESTLLQQDRNGLEAVRAARAEQASAYFRENAAAWNEIRALHMAEEAIEAALLDMLGPEPVGSLVDLGTGTGRMLALIGPRSQRAVGLDTSRDMLAIARSVLERSDLRHCHVRQGDMLASPFADASFDVAIINQVLHYLQEPAKALREAARILAPGGRLLVVDFAPHKEESLRENHAHRRLGFAEAEVSRWAGAAGLELVECRHLHGESETFASPEPSAAADGMGAAAPAQLTVSIWMFQRPVASDAPLLEVAQ